MNEHSRNYEKVLKYYMDGNWDDERVRNAVGKWITQEECEFILSQRIGEGHTV